jgi:hypothetical protein
MKSSLRSPILFLPLFCQLPTPETHSIQFTCSQAHVPAGWRLETRLDSAELFFITTLRGPRRKHSLSIVACVFIAAGICLRSRCLAMNVYSDFTIPAFGRHVTVFPIFIRQWEIRAYLYTIFLP